MTPDANLLRFFAVAFFIKKFFLFFFVLRSSQDDGNFLSLTQRKLVWKWKEKRWMENQLWIKSERPLLAFLFVLLVVHGNPL